MLRKFREWKRARARAKRLVSLVEPVETTDTWPMWMVMICLAILLGAVVMCPDLSGLS